LNPVQAEGLEEKVRRVSEENRRLAAMLGAILADHPHLRSLATSPASAIAATAARTTRSCSAANVAREEIIAVNVEPQPKVRTVRARAEPSGSDANLVSRTNTPQQGIAIMRSRAL
jgi:hypothetical protein